MEIVEKVKKQYEAELWKKEDGTKYVQTKFGWFGERVYVPQSVALLLQFVLRRLNNKEEKNEFLRKVQFMAALLQESNGINSMDYFLKCIQIINQISQQGLDSFIE